MNSGQAGGSRQALKGARLLWMSMSTPTPDNGPYNDPHSAPHGQPLHPYAAPPGGYPVTYEQPEQSGAVLSLVFGLIGLVFLPFIFGPLAISAANNARNKGNTSGIQTAGRVLGWIGTIYGVILLLVLVVILIVVNA